MSNSSSRTTFPVQIKGSYRYASDPTVSEPVQMAAYEVYEHVHGAQPELLVGNCRGGFSTDEIVVFLYARAFPKSEWRKRIEEAYKGLNI